MRPATRAYLRGAGVSGAAVVVMLGVARLATEGGGGALPSIDLGPVADRLGLSMGSREELMSGFAALASTLEERGERSGLEVSVRRTAFGLAVEIGYAGPEPYVSAEHCFDCAEQACLWDSPEEREGREVLRALASVLSASDLKPIERLAEGSDARLEVRFAAGTDARPIGHRRSRPVCRGDQRVEESREPSFREYRSDECGTGVCAGPNGSIRLEDGMPISTNLRLGCLRALCLAKTAGFGDRVDEIVTLSGELQRRTATIRVELRSPEGVRGDADDLWDRLSAQDGAS